MASSPTRSKRRFAPGFLAMEPGTPLTYLERIGCNTPGCCHRIATLTSRTARNTSVPPRTVFVPIAWSPFHMTPRKKSRGPCLLRDIAFPIKVRIDTWFTNGATVTASLTLPSATIPAELLFATAMLEAICRQRVLFRRVCLIFRQDDRGLPVISFPEVSCRITLRYAPR